MNYVIKSRVILPLLLLMSRGVAVEPMKKEKETLSDTRIEHSHISVWMFHEKN
jgi:hypothetical protein